MSRTLPGMEVVVREGTLPDPPVSDYDDAWIYACARHAEIVFDVGSNVGQSALLMLSTHHVKRLVLVDPNWSALAMAAENLIRNQLSRACQFVCGFASDQSGTTIDFWTVGTGAAGSMYHGHAETAARRGSVMSVPTITLDQICTSYDLVPDLVKIDIEGAEHKALVGSTKLASRHQSRFLVEMHSPPELPMARNAELVLGWAADVGYTAWYLSQGTRVESPAAIAHRGRCHLLLQPVSWSYPDWLVGIGQSAPLPEG